jgi:5'-nucleotidase
MSPKLGRPSIRVAAILVAVLLAPLASAAQNARPRILVVNDDGIASEGIAALATELRTFADVVVVAPAENSSGSSHSTVIRNIRAELTPLVRNGQVFGYAINATPADATKFGILHFGARDPFDLVVSGINAGANTGHVAHVSGTVGAAMEALAFGIPAIATSQDVKQDYRITSRITAGVVRQVLQRGLPPGVMLSINVPAGTLKGVKAGAMGGWYFSVGGFEEVDRKGATVVYRATMREADRGGSETDTSAYLDGYVSIAPLRFDWTDQGTLDRLANWDLAIEP